ncbi:WD40 repeat domain-containing protein [Streptomyces radiopugnans]|uniref:WD40 repeat domain-containing protein n=1 Tax=Streptomyces radiopugnans TaxID=403935 RepID=UPI003F1C0274
MAFVPGDDTTLAVVERFGRVWLWDTGTGDVRRILPGHRGGVRSGRPTRRRGWRRSRQDLHRERRRGTGVGRGGAKVRQAFPIGRSERRDVVEVAFAPDGRTVAVSDFLPGGKAQVWDAETGVLRGTLPADGGSGEGPEFSGANAPADGRPCLATSMEFDPGGAVLAVGCEDGGVRLWDVGTGRVRDTLTGHRGAVDSVVFGPGGLIATGDGKGTRVWEAPVLGPEEMVGKICESLSSNRWPIRRQSFPTHRLPDWVCSP